MSTGAHFATSVCFSGRVESDVDWWKNNRLNIDESSQRKKSKSSESARKC
jgi:hypothetical protein